MSKSTYICFCVMVAVYMAVEAGGLAFAGIFSVQTWGWLGAPICILLFIVAIPLTGVWMTVTDWVDKQRKGNRG